MDASKHATPADPYTVLGVDRKAGLAEIKQAYFTLVRQYPPEEQPEQFKQVRQAYDQLKSPEQRAMVDLFLLQPPPAASELSKSRYDLTVHIEDMIRLAAEFRLAELSFQKEFREPELAGV